MSFKKHNFRRPPYKNHKKGLIDMKKRLTTKILCVLFSLTMILSAAVILPSAEDHKQSTLSTTINDSLVTHWDFEGEDYFTDHAVAPSKKTEQLGIFEGSTEGAISVANGVLSITPDDKTSLWMGDLATTFEGFNLGNATTYYARIKLDAKNTNFVHIMQMEGLFRFYVGNDQKLAVQIYADSIGTAKTVAMTNALPIGEFVDVALSFTKPDTTGTTWKVSLYCTTSDGSFYTQQDVAVSSWKLGNGRGTNTNNKYGLYVGNNRVKRNPGTTVHIDDIRVYSTSMSLAQFKQIPRLHANAPVVVGCQNTTNLTSNYDVRFLATLKHLNYTEAGFKVVMNYTDRDGNPVEKIAEKICKNAYLSLTADDATTPDIDVITAEALGGAFVIALTVQDVPCDLNDVDDKITFTVTAYGKDANGTYTSIPVVFTYEGGVYKTAATA